MVQCEKLQQLLVLFLILNCLHSTAGHMEI